MSTRCILAIVGCLVVLLPSSAEAGLRKDAAKVTLVSPPRPARAGEVFESTMRIQVVKGIVISDLVLTGSGWTAIEFEPPFPATTGDPVDVTVPFRAVPGNPDAPLVLEFTYNGWRERRFLDVSPSAYERTLPQRLLSHPPGETPQFSTRDFAPAEILPGIRDRWTEIEKVLATPSTSRVSGGPERSPTGRTITISGRLICRHELTDIVPMTNHAIGAFGADDAGHNTFFTPTSGDTDPDGYFSLDLYWPYSTDPDIQLLFAARNDAVIVQENDVYEDTWSFASPVYENVDTDQLVVGFVEPETQNSHAAMYLAETLVRAREYLRITTGWIAPQVELLWPDSDGSNYSWLQEIHISTEDRWTEHVVLHEYGHHFNVCGFGYYHDHTGELDYYCNGNCDEIRDWALDDCGHCLWCDESGRVAWNEGLANFLSRFMSNGIENGWDTPEGGLDHLPIDALGVNSSCPDPQDPAKTEGYFAAVMWDLVDGLESDHDDPEFDPAVSPFADRMSGWEDEVLDVINSTCADYGRRPRYPMEFLRCFIHEFHNYREDIWETFVHNGYNLDEDPPPVPSGFTMSPALNIPSPDNTITIGWDRPADDASGVYGYSSRWSATGSDPGTATTSLLDVTREISDPLAPGTWYYTIRTLDRSGKWSTTYAVVGPFVILEPDPVELEPTVPTGWDYCLVPRNDEGASVGNVHLSSFLNGGQDNTYWSAALHNTGDQMSVPTSATLWLDDENNPVDAMSVGGLNGGVGSQGINQGPVQIFGGRHVLGLRIDAEETNAEPNEFNNYWATQFVWYPEQLYTSVATDLPSPPPVNGGLDYYSYETPYYIPCDGLDLPPAFWFSAVTMYSQSLGVDYDLAIYDDTHGVENGFKVPKALSARPAGSLEAVLVNIPVMPYADYYVGTRNQTLNWDASNADYRIRGVRGQTITATYGTFTGTLSADRMLDLYNFGVDPATGGSLTITLVPEAGATRMYLGYFDPSFGIGTLLDADPIVSAAGGDSVTISVPGPFSELAAVAVWREPGDDGLTYYRDYTLRFEGSPPDPGAWASSKWAAPIVPQRTAYILPPYSLVPAPTLLSGDGPTYLYLSEKNYSVATAPEHDITSLLDGEPVDVSLSPAELAGLDTYKFMVSAPVTVPGGRHTLGMEVDRSQDLHEILESNNTAARQWVWRPATLSWNATLSIDTSTDPVGGWEALSFPTPAFFNCLGFRMPSVTTRDNPYTVAFLACASQVDGDLRIHPVSAGAEDGFDYPEKSSGLSAGKADFVIVRTSAVAGAALDVGVVAMNGGGRMYLEADSSGSSMITTPGRYDGLALVSGEFVDLYQIRLPAGAYSFRLRPTGDDLAMSLHLVEDAYSGRLDALVEADEAGVDGEEEIQVLFDSVQTHVLAVWRPGTRNYTDPADYTILIDESSIGVGDDPPGPGVPLGFTASPNPFDVSTAFHVETSREGPLRMTIHDMRGALVRSFERGTVPAGHHLLAWDGRDEHGQRTVPGVYFARLVSADRERITKVIKMR